MSRVSKNNITTKFSTALYVRLSREDGDDKVESNSITNQKEMLMNYISSNNDVFELYNIYSDENYTGTNFNRPSFQQLISDIESKLINCVIVKDLSRFGRDYIETGRYLERVFPEYNVRFIAINDNIDSFKQAYNMLLPISNIFNQQYAIDISNKVQSSFKVKQNSGKFIGAFASYGYSKNKNDNNKLVIDEYAAQIVRRIFKMYLEGMGQLKIAKILNDEKVYCPSEYKKQCGLNYKNSNKFTSTNYWTFSTVRNILKNQMYVGDMVQNKTKRLMKSKAKYRPEDEWIIVKDTHDKIIERDVWEKVQNLVNRNTRQLDFEQNISIFAGFLTCSDCKRALAKNKRRGTIYYVCGSHKRYGANYCTPHSITHNKLEKMVMDYINFISEEMVNLKQIAESQKKISKNISNIKKEIEKNMISISKLYSLKKGIYEDYKEGILSKDEYLQYKEDYEKTEKLYNDKVITLQDQVNCEDDDVFKNEWLIKLLETKKIEKLDRETMADFISNIEVSENKTISITWNCDDNINDLINNIISADI